MTKFSEVLAAGVTIRESANDGSDFSNPTADYRRLFLGEDGGLHLKDSAGTVTDVGGASGAVATDAIWDAAGDLAQGTGSNTAARLALGAAGTVVRSTGSANAYAFPPGHEFDYVAKTADTSITATTEGTANTVITASAVAYDGSTIVLVEFFSPNVRPTATAGDIFTFVLYDDTGGGAASVGKMARIIVNSATDVLDIPLTLSVRLTPSAATHTYSVRAYTASGTAHTFPSGDGIGGSGHFMAQYIRQTKV